jgi:YesN/AraC family two-component response regulator
VELGSADLENDISYDELVRLKAALLRADLELMDDTKSMLVEKIKQIIIEVVHYSDEPLNMSFSKFLSLKLLRDYTYLATLFSESQGITIEKFIITHKIDHVKELLAYNKLSLTEIANLMNYSSVSHLSTQFKKVTGLTPTLFIKLLEGRNTMPGDV